MINLQDTDYLKTLTAAGVKACKLVVKRVKEEVADDPGTALEIMQIGRRHKEALRIDGAGEDALKATVKGYKGKVFRKIVFYGEESLKDPTLDLSGLTSVCALMDAVDGTDLVERGLGNWCSNVIFFAPSEPVGMKILASIVALPNEDVYFARRDSDEVEVVRKGNGKTRLKLGAISECKTLREASICFYGQKVKNLNSTIKSGLWNYITCLNSKTEGLKLPSDKCRIYNLAGVPMMMKLIDPVHKDARGIDAIFDIAGQQPHDVIPGAYIAMKAGAILKNINGSRLKEKDLEKHLMKPSSESERMRYVLAGTEELCDEIIQAISCGHKISD